jgi:hypothetical protein
MRKITTSASGIVQDLSRRGIKPDVTEVVSQGVLNLWRYGQNYVGELIMGGEKKPGCFIITGKNAYENTRSAQEIADDLLMESELPPMHGGKREGAGRPETGRKQRKLQATDEEWAQITLQSKQAGYATVSEYIRAKTLENN